MFHKIRYVKSISKNYHAQNENNNRRRYDEQYIRIKTQHTLYTTIVKEEAEFEMLITENVKLRFDQELKENNAILKETMKQQTEHKDPNNSFVLTNNISPQPKRIPRMIMKKSNTRDTSIIKKKG